MNLITKAFKITLGVLLAFLVIVVIVNIIARILPKPNYAQPNTITSPPPTIPQNNGNPTIEPTKKTVVKQPTAKYIRYLKGKKGGCYYVNQKGKKVYVDASMCQ